MLLRASAGCARSALFDWWRLLVFGLLLGICNVFQPLLFATRAKPPSHFLVAGVIVGLATPRITDGAILQEAVSIGSGSEGEHGSYGTEPCSNEFRPWILLFGVVLVTAGICGSWYGFFHADDMSCLAYGFIVVFGSLGVIGLGEFVIWEAVGVWHVCTLSSVSVPGLMH